MSPQYLGSLKWLNNGSVLKTMRVISSFTRKRHQNHPTIIGGEIDETLQNSLCTPFSGTPCSSAIHEQILPELQKCAKLQRDIYLNTEVEYMKQSNTLADNATIKQLQREI